MARTILKKKRPESDLLHGKGFFRIVITQDSDSWVICEPKTSYNHRSSVIENLTGRAYSEKQLSFTGLRDLIHKGLDRKAFDRFRDGAGISTEELCIIAGIPKRTLSRRDRFKPEESDRIFRVASAFQKTVEVLENLGAARKWFSTPKKALDGLTPLQCCDTETGAREVEDLLGRIEHGVFA